MIERAKIIEEMCMTYRHDYGLHITDEMIAKHGLYARLGSGMTTEQRDALRRNMEQIYRHNIEPVIAPLIARVEELERENEDIKNHALGYILGYRSAMERAINVADKLLDASTDAIYNDTICWIYEANVGDAIRDEVNTGKGE